MTREELISKIEESRRKLDTSISNHDNYDEIYKCSIELDGLIEEYIVAGYSRHTTYRGGKKRKPKHLFEVSVFFLLIFCPGFGKNPCQFPGSVLE